MRVIFSAQAKADLIAIGDYIAKDSPGRALDFVRRLRAVARQLGEAPLSYPLLSRHQHHGIRRRAWRDYLILYRVEEGRVFIVHVLHGARDYEALLFPES